MKQPTLLQLITALAIDLIAYFIPAGLLIRMYDLLMTQAVIENNAQLKTQALLMLLCAFAISILEFAYLPLFTKGQTIGRKLTKTRLIFLQPTGWQGVIYYIREYLVRIVFVVVYLPLLIIWHSYQYFTLNKKQRLFFDDYLKCDIISER